MGTREKRRRRWYEELLRRAPYIGPMLVGSATAWASIRRQAIAQLRTLVRQKPRLLVGE